MPPVLINRIAAGEVVERPAAAVKELVENAIDAGAARIEVTLHEGGQRLIVVADDGSGMSPDELSLAVERHCTSKLPDDDLLRIAALGFRGEALPSIGAVSRLRILSRPPACREWLGDHGRGRAQEPSHPGGGGTGDPGRGPRPLLCDPGAAQIPEDAAHRARSGVDAVRRLAMAYPRIAFAVIAEDGRALLRLPPAGERRARLAALLGRDFADNSIEIAAERGGFRLSGLAGLPTLNRALPRDQYLTVNGRPVRDKLLVGAVRGAYQDVLARDRHPIVALFLDGPEDEIDVNVHPAKAEVRFRDAALVRGLIVGALRAALAAAGHRASTTVATAAFAAFRPGGAPSPHPSQFAFPPPLPAPGLAEAAADYLAPDPPAPPPVGGAARQRAGAAPRHLYPGRDPNRDRAR